MSLPGGAFAASVIDGLLADARKGNGRTIVLSGDLGSGKTTFLDRLTTIAAAQGMLCLSVAASQAEHSVPLAAVRQLIEDLPPGPLGTGTPEPSTPEPSTPAVPGPTALHLWDAVRRACTRSPVVVAIDDAQVMDAASLDVVTFLARRCRRRPLLIVVAESTHEGLAGAVRDDFLRSPGARDVTLPPLDPSDIGRALADRCPGLRPQDRASLSHLVHQVTGGIPLLVTAALADLDPTRNVVPGTADAASAAGGRQRGRGRGRHQVGAVPGRGPASVRATQRLLRGLGPDTVRIAQGLLVLGPDIKDGRLDRCLDLPAGSAAHAVRRLNDLMLWDGDRPRPHVEAVIRASMPQTTGAELHRAAAGCLLQEHGPADAVAGHLMGSGSLTEDWQSRVVHEAATAALRRVDLHRAVELASFGRRFAGPSWGRPFLLLLVRALHLLEPARIGALLAGLVDLADAGRLSEPELLSCLQHLLWHGRRADARRIAGLLLDGATRPPGVPEALWWMRAVWPEDADEPAPAPCRCLERLGHALHDHDHDRSDGESHAGAGTRAGPGTAPTDAAGLGSCGRPQLHIAALVGSMLLEGDPARAATWLAEARDRPDPQDPPSHRSVIAALEGQLALHEGDLLRSRHHFGRALDTIGPRGWGIAVGLPLSGLLHTGSALTDTTAVERLLSIPLPDDVMDSPLYLPYLRARGLHRLSSGQRPAAVLDLSTYADLARRWGIDAPELLPWRADLALLALRCNDLDRARRLAEEQLERLGPDQHRPRGITLRILALTMPVARRPPLLAGSLEHLDAVHAQLERAITLLHVARTHHSLGGRTEAVSVAEQARRLAHRCGAARLATAIEHDLVLTRVPGGGRLARPAPRPLTNAERRVCQLAAQDHSNQQIAGMLGVTVSTVEQHLTRAYRKLGVLHRRELATALRAALTTATAPGPAPSEVDQPA